MCIPDLRVPLDDYAIPDNEGVFEEPQRGEDIYYSDYESSSDSSSGNWYDPSYVHGVFYYCHNELNVHCLIYNRLDN